MKTVPDVAELMLLPLTEAEALHVRAQLERDRAEWDQLSAYICGLDYLPEAEERVALVREYAERSLPGVDGQALGELLVGLGMA